VKRGVACLALVLLMVACFSERDATEPVAEGECRVPLSAIGPNKAVIAIRNFQFFPDTVRIRPGGEVTWVNCETDVNDFHTSTSEAQLWDSGALNQGEFYTRRFDADGSFSFFCIPHPTMRGAVIVQ
jgi:plastocyanin